MFEVTGYEFSEKERTIKYIFGLLFVVRCSRLQKNIHFQHGDATRDFDYTLFYIEISSPVNYTAIIVHMRVPSRASTVWVSDWGEGN